MIVVEAESVGDEVRRPRRAAHLYDTRSHITTNDN